MKNVFNKFLWLLIFGIAMGFIESAVVVYLREIYYPNGFNFPLNTWMSQKIYLTEVSREIATILMLLSISILVGKNLITKISVFLFSFSVWDIFYYVFLKLILDWPKTFFDWDVLFLIPVCWIAPVITPIINSLTFICIAIILELLNLKFEIKNLKLTEVVSFILGIIITFVSYTYDFTKFLLTTKSVNEFNKVVGQYIPQNFNWFLFFVGEAFFIISIFLVYKRINKS